jgi:serine protease Do
MPFRRLFAGLAVLTAAVLVVFVYGMRARAQDTAPGRPDGPRVRTHGHDEAAPGPRTRELSVLAGRGAEIGASVRDLEPAEVEKQKVSGVFVEDVRPDSAAEKAGLKRSDVVVEFDGERVRSARQFSRLVQETPPGRSVRATVMRDGKRTDLQVTPTEGRSAMFRLEGDGLDEHVRGSLGDMRGFLDRMPPMTFDFDLPGFSPRGRLGVTVHELTDQLAGYFGVREGLLVAAVTDDSPAARGGIRAGDVITSVNTHPVRSHEDLVRELAEVHNGETTIGIVREKKEITAKVTLESPRRLSRTARPA